MPDLRSIYDIQVLIRPIWSGRIVSLFISATDSWSLSDTAVVQKAFAAHGSAANRNAFSDFCQVKALCIS